jgi:LAO/AO transport system kinase
MKEGDWLPPILKAKADRKEGLEELVAAIEAHRAHVQSSGLLEEKRRRRLRDEVLDMVAERSRRRAAKRLAPGTPFGDQLATASLKELDPYEMAGDIMKSDG